MIDSRNIKNLGLIQDHANPMAKQVRHKAEIIVEMFRQTGHDEIAEAVEKGMHTEP